MPKKLTQEEVIERARIVHGDRYDYSLVDYVNIDEKICIICKDHGIFWQSAYVHLNGCGCPKCRAEKLSKMTASTKEVFTEKARLKHGDLYDYSKVEYVNSRTKVEIICKEHGSFWQTPKNHLNGTGCPVCAGLQKKTSNLFIEESIKVHGNKYDYSKVEYKGNKIKVCIICPIHGEFWQTPNSHLRGRGCDKCGGSSDLTKEEFIKKANKIHNGRYNYTLVDFKNTSVKVKIICPIHGIFEQTPHNHLNGAGCPVCRTSKGELSIKNYLDSKNIFYKHQYRMHIDEKLFSRNNLKVDFYLPIHNIIIEFNGIQHYKYEPFFHRDGDAFGRQVDRDKRLKEYCKRNKIKLIVIKYDEIDKIESILNKKIKKEVEQRFKDKENETA